MKTFAAFMENDDGLGVLASSDLSSETVARLTARLTQGIRVFRGKTEGSEPHDAGDFGAGVYHSSSKARAATYGTLGAVFLTLRRPLVLSGHEAYDKLTHLHDTVTARQGDRTRNARLLARKLMARGYDGLAIVNVRNGEIEYVRFVELAPED